MIDNVARDNLALGCFNNGNLEREEILTRAGFKDLSNPTVIVTRQPCDIGNTVINIISRYDAINSAWMKACDTSTKISNICFRSRISL